MTSAIYSLCWKEFHEHKWKLVSITAILCSIATILLFVGDTRDTVRLITVFVATCAIPLSIFVGLGAAAGERSHRTLPFLQSIPVPMWWTAIAKLVFGVATLVLSMLLTTAFLYAAFLILWWCGIDFTSATRSYEKYSITGRWYVDFFAAGAAIAASFYIWSSAAGVNRKDEISAGAVALAVMTGWCLFLFAALVLINSGGPINSRNKWATGLLLSAAPGGFIPGSTNPRDLSSGLWLVVVGALVTHLALATFYVRRFGRVSTGELSSPQVAVRNSVHTGWLGPPRRFSWSAIAWKQLRESSRIALAGLAGSVGITAVLLVPAAFYYRSTAGAPLGQVFPNMSVFLGFFVALVTGIGVCVNDVSPSANTFWRSRPIQPDLWFWTKFVTGLLVVMASIYLPIGLLAAFHVPILQNWNFPDAYMIPVIHVAVFSAAVAMTCLVRHAVYAAILSIATVYIFTVIGLAITVIAGALNLVTINMIRWWEPSVAQTAFGLALSFTVTTIVAWLATRYDWGRTG